MGKLSCSYKIIPDLVYIRRVLFGDEMRQPDVVWNPCELKLVSYCK